MKKISIEEFIQSSYMGEKFKKTKSILLESINDWPDEIVTLEQFVNKISDFITNVPTKNNISNVLDKIDYSVNSWQAESLSGLLEVFDFYKDDVSLQDIVEDISSKLEM